MARRDRNRRGAVPIVAEMVLLGVTITLAFVVYFVALGMSSSVAATPVTVFTEKHATDKEIELTFGPCVPVARFADCRLEITSPDPANSHYQVMLSETEQYALNGTCALTIRDPGGSGKIASGDTITVNDSRHGGLYKGDWQVVLVFEPTGAFMATATVTI
jgi:FlaG/FlaF family flagellin (archaellin)